MERQHVTRLTAGLLFLAFAGFYIVFIVFSSSSINWRGSYTWSTFRSVGNNIVVSHDFFLWRNDGSCRLYFEFGGRVYRDGNEMENLTLAGIDGQKSVCLDPGLAPPPGICVVYSFGLSDDWSFESAMALYGCDVYAFDPSLQFPKMPNNSQRIHYFNIGLGTINTKKDSRGWKMTTLASIRKYLLHSYRPIDFLKIDIEGDEWLILEHMLQDGRSLRSVKQISMEVHLLHSDRLHYYRNLTQQLEDSGYVRFFSRQNRWMKNAYELAWFNVNYSSKGYHQQKLILSTFYLPPSTLNGSLSWKEMLPFFSRRDILACKTYYEFGGVINRLPSLTFLDGQKSVCLDQGVAPVPDQCVVYSFGNNGEWSFDEQIESYGCYVYVFDPSVWYWKHHHSKKVLFYRVGIGEKDDERNERRWKIMSLTSLRQMLNHTNTIIDYLKMDIEGGEWPVLSRWLDDGDLLNVKQLAMEIHLENPESIPGKYNLLQRLEASGFTRFFARENPYTTDSYLIKYNVTGPSCLELAWYNTKFVR